MIQMTWPGAPTVYYGDEAGVCGWTDPDNRRTYPWGHEDQQMLAFHREAIRIHRQSSALRTGSVKLLCGGDSYLAFGRFDEKERYVTVVNNRERSLEVDIPVLPIGTASGRKMERLLSSSRDSFETGGGSYTVTNGHLTLRMPARSGMILKEV